MFHPGFGACRAMQPGLVVIVIDVGTIIVVGVDV
jgi:hypothetical protein